MKSRMIDWLLGKRRRGSEIDPAQVDRRPRQEEVYINIIYNDGSEDMVRDVIFEELLKLNKIKRFFRHSESRWVTVGVDPIRKSREKTRYRGPERRKPRRKL